MRENLDRFRAEALPVVTRGQGIGVHVEFCFAREFIISKMVILVPFDPFDPSKSAAAKGFMNFMYGGYIIDILGLLLQ